MDRYDESLFDEMDEAEGPAAGFDEFDEMDEADEYNEFDEADEGDEYDEFDEGDEFDEADDDFDEMDETDEFDEGDEFDQGDEFESFDEGDEFDEGEEFDEEAFDEALAYALGAEDTDEFFKRLFKGVRKVAGKVGKAVKRGAKAVGKVARVVGPIASMIPLPQAQAIGRVANVVGKLMADEASEDEALEAFAELAVRNPAARPIAAAIAARKVLGPAAARMSKAKRLRAIRTVRKATNTLARKGGPKMVRALPRIAKSVRRTAAVRRTPAPVRPKVLARTAIRVATRNPQLRKRLARPLPRGKRVIAQTAQAVRRGSPPAAQALRIITGSLPNSRGRRRRGFGGVWNWGGYPGGVGGDYRRIVTRGPVRITVRPA